MSAMIRPSDIDTTKHFWKSFGRQESEISGRMLVKFCQERDDTWAPVDKVELDEWAGEDFWFNGLDQGDNPYLELDGDIVRITDRFIKTAFGARGKLSRPEELDDEEEEFASDRYAPALRPSDVRGPQGPLMARPEEDD